MGGHGGLNILPQKRWNVYNFDNREKVKKDEEEAARKEAVEKEQARQRDAEFRLERLREAAQAKKRDTNELRINGGEGAAQPLLENSGDESGRDRVDGSGSGAEWPRRFSLFDGIEIVDSPAGVSGKLRDGIDRKGGAKEGERDDLKKFRDYRDKKEAKEIKLPGPEDEGYAFGYGLVGKNGKKPWYSTKGFMVERTSNEAGGSHTARSRSPVEERPEKRRRTKEVKSEKRTKSNEKKPEKHVEKKDKVKTGGKSIEELRAERVKREQQERDKARKLIIANRKPDAYGSYGVNRSGRPFYNQSFGNAR